MRPLALALALVACGARPSLPVHPPTTTNAPVQIGEMAVVVRRRATDGRMAAGLFVRAPEGPAGLRATAALVLEARATALRVRATADGLALRVSADEGALDATLATLASAIATRTVSASEMESALVHLRARRAGRAHDDRGLAQRLAVEALADADLDPLGAPADDAAITSEAVATWLSDVLGVERALLVLVGDAIPESAHERIAHAFEAAPHVSTTSTAALAWSGGPARVAIEDHAYAAAATTAATLEEATRVAAWVPQLVPSAHATAFPLRGRAVVVASCEGEERMLTTLASALRHAHRLDEETPSVTALAADDEVLAIGDAWLASLTGETSDRVGLGLVRHGDGDDAAPRTEASLDALASTEPEDTRASDERRGEMTLANGVHVRVARAEGDEVAVALSWNAGAALDPAREHGRMSLVASVVARSCEPDADDAWIDASSFGIVVRGDRASLERTVLRAIDCARRSRSEIEHVEGVRAAAIAEIDLGSRLRAWASSVLAPGTPGLIAPAGSSAGLAAAAGLDDTLADAIDSRRATLTIVADASPDHLLDVADGMGTSLAHAARALAASASSAPSADDAFTSAIDLDAPLAVVALRTDAGESEAAAAHVATTLARALAGRGLIAHVVFSGAARGSSFAAVLLSGSDAALDGLPSASRAALAAIDVPITLAADAGASARRHALALADPAILARDLATSATPEADPVATARALLAATPRFVMVRPRAR